jgi:hypothetical protein
MSEGFDEYPMSRMAKSKGWDEHDDHSTLQVDDAPSNVGDIRCQDQICAKLAGLAQVYVVFK